MDMQALFEIIDSLEPAELQQLRDYLEHHHTETPSPSPDTPRILGLHAHLGSAWMSDDFNAELPDDFWGWDKQIAQHSIEDET